MYVVKSRQAAFIHIPKTGGTAIARHIVWPLGFKRYGGRPRHRGYLPDCVPDDWFIFGFVRDPYTRIASLYRHQLMRPRKLDVSSLSAFINYLWERDEKLGKPTAQVDFLAPCVEVFRYEAFSKSVDEICRRLGIEVPRFRRTQENKFYGRYDWRTFMDEKAVEVINDRFCRDFTELGYEMKTWKQMKS